MTKRRAFQRECAKDRAKRVLEDYIFEGLHGEPDWESAQTLAEALSDLIESLPTEVEIQEAMLHRRNTLSERIFNDDMAQGFAQGAIWASTRD